MHTMTAILIFADHSTAVRVIQAPNAGRGTDVHVAHQALRAEFQDRADIQQLLMVLPSGEVENMLRHETVWAIGSRELIRQMEASL